MENNPASNAETLPPPMVHETAEVHPKATIGDGTQIWNWSQVRELASVGEQCILGKGVYIDRGVSVGDKVKIQNNVSVFEGVTIEDGVFIGPHVCFTNDIHPRAVNDEFELKSAEDWIITPTRVCRGASIGANATILPGITVGEFAMVGAGSVVTRDIPEFALVYGSPARIIGRVNKEGQIIEK